jgi:6-phosphofructokinase 1
LLTPEIVDDIHEQGGTILGSSRGQQSTEAIVDTLLRMNINMVFCVGGDGTLRAAHEMAEEIKARGQAISVVGIPKTIDNDLNFVGRTFGFETAVYEASRFISLAHNEAKGAVNGVGLVKLMGRDSGFIAAYTALANSLVNICLIPELPFTLEGENGLFKALERRFDMGKDHAVIVVAEGAGQDLIKDEEQDVDASGNILKKDVGIFLEDKIEAHFKKIEKECSVKYFDPSYAIRSIPAKGTDAILCYLLAVNAAHAAMAGKTNCVIGQMGSTFVHVPIALATKERQKLDKHSSIWKGVLDATRQNDYFYAK